MGYKLQRYNGSSWDNLLKDLYIEIDNTNWTSHTLSSFLDEVSTSLEGKEDRNVVKIINNYSASAFDIVLVDTSNTITITLPSSPSRGDRIKIIDVTGNAGTNNITVNRNSENINGSAEDVLMDVDFNILLLVYDNTSNGWVIDIGGAALGWGVSNFKDNFITLNADVQSGTPSENCGMIVSRGDSNDAILQWNETSDKWQITTDGTNYYNILTTDDLSSIDHGNLAGLSDDDHTQYVHTSTARTITAQHTFNPSSVGAPFTIGANANKQMVSGLNSNYINGLLVSSQTGTPSDISSHDIWVQET